MAREIIDFHIYMFPDDFALEDILFHNAYCLPGERYV